MRKAVNGLSILVVVLLVNTLRCCPSAAVCQ